MIESAGRIVYPRLSPLQMARVCQAKIGGRPLAA